jgi:hypothetical protein
MKTLRHRALTLLIAVIFAIVAVDVSPAWRVTAAKNPITVISQSAKSVFGKSLTFAIKAKSSAGNIISVRLLRRFLSQSSAHTELLTNFKPAAQVSLQYVWQTGTETIPPWQVVRYQWELADSAGNIYKTPVATAEFADQTFPWKRRANRKVAVFYYGHDDSFGEALFAAAQLGYDDVLKATGHTPEYGMRVVIYNDQAAFCSFYVRQECKDWVGGQTYAGITVQWLNQAADPDHRYLFNQLIPHELAHAFLWEWVKNNRNTIPSWFDEGQAMNNQREGLGPFLERARALGKANRLIPLSSLGSTRDLLTANIEQVKDWYAQAASLVTFLYVYWDRKSLGKIVSKVNAGKDFYTALKEVTGLTLSQFEAKWLQWVNAS